MSLAVFILASCAKEDPKVDATTLQVQQTVESRSELCDEDDYCNSGAPDDNLYFNRTIYIDGCEVRVKYWVRKCLSPTYGSIVKFTDIDIQYAQTAACFALFPSSPVSTGVAYNNALNALYKRVLDKIESDYMNSIYPEGTKNVVQFKEAFCYKWCLRTFDDGRGNIWMRPTTIKCGRSCCTRVTTYTRDVGNVWVKGPTVVTGDPLCAPLDNVEVCGLKGESVGICNVACARL